ncbi:MAG: FMN-binding protein [Frankia sp.]
MRRALLAVFSTIAGLVMLLSFKTEATSVAAPPAAVSTTTGTGTTSGTSSSTSPSSTSSSSSPSSTSSSTGTKTVTGSAVSTRYGPVQVQITITNGAITGVTAVEYPQGNPRDAQINAVAVPQLNQEATAAKNATIDTISGATYTSQGYIESLQSALNKAGL